MGPFVSTPNSRATPEPPNTASERRGPRPVNRDTWTGRHGDYLLEGALVVILMSVYLATLLPGLALEGDTPKFQFIGQALGTPHPTGFPSYIFINWLFTTVFPAGTLAYKTNLLSACLSVVGSIALFRLVVLLTSDGLAAAVAALAFGLTSVLWTYSLLAEVYTLHLAFIGWTLLLLCQWQATRRRSYLLVACAIYAVSFGNHLTSIALLPAIVYIVARTDIRSFRHGPTVGAVAGVIALGMLQYGYLFWRTFDPTTAYLEISTPDLTSFIYWVSGGPFRSMMFTSSPADFVSVQVPRFLEHLLAQFSWSSPLIVVGMLSLCRQHAVALTFLLLAASGNTFLA